MPGWNAAVQEDVEVEEGVDGDACNFGRPCPPRLALCLGARGEQMCPGEEVQVEARDCHDRVVSVLLIWNGEGGNGVPEVAHVVVARPDGAEEERCRCEQRNVLNVGVVFLPLKC